MTETAIPWWVHPLLAACLLGLTATTVYVGRKSAKAPTESYEPIEKMHIRLAITTVSFAAATLILGPFLMNEYYPPNLQTAHAFVGILAGSLWLAQAGLGWLLWNEKEKIRRFHRYNGFVVLSLALVQVPFGLMIFFDFLAYF